MTNEHRSSSITPVIDAPANQASTFFAPPWVRLGAQLFAASLDTKLSAGEHPATSHLLAARAQQLASASYRRGLADSWLDLLIEVRRPRTFLDPAVMPVRSRVIAADAQIRSLADALVTPLPAVRGLAMAIAVLRDGAGPLFNPMSRVQLTSSLEEIIAQLNPLTSLAGI